MAELLRPIEQERTEQSNIIDLISNREKITVRKEITRAVNEVMDEFRFTGNINPDLVLNHQKRLTIIMETIIDRAVNISAERQFNIFKKSHDKGLETKQLSDSFNRLLNKFKEEQSVIKAEFAAQTTSKEIRQAIDEEQSKEESTRDSVVDSVKEDVGKDRASNRSALIAVSLTHTAVNWGTLTSSQEMADELDLNLEKEWIYTFVAPDPRQVHVAMNGVKVNVRDTFLVGGESMTGPGDPNASLENTINCRCVLGFLEITQ